MLFKFASLSLLGEPAIKAKGEKALILYLTAGDPDLETTGKLILALDAAEVDILEIGVPFSDPTADGPVIQEAAQRSLRRGTILAAILKMIAVSKRSSGLPRGLFTIFPSRASREQKNPKRKRLPGTSSPSPR